MKKVIYALLAIFLISITFVIAQEARSQLIVLNNGEYTITYLAEELEDIIKVTQRQNPGRTETLLFIHSFEKNTRIGLLKSGNIKKKIVGSGRNRRNILEVKNQTRSGILELDHFTINGTFRISTEAIENGQVTRFELDRDAVLTALTNDQDGELLIRCRANDRNCLRTVEFIEKENLLEQYVNIRGEAELVRAKTEQQEETVLTSLQNIRGAIITEETIEAGTRLKIIGIPYLARRPGSLISWNRLKSDSTTLFEQTYAPNGIASSSKITASSALNVYDTCAKQNCGLTIFEVLENSQVVFLNGNTPILQLIEGKIGVVETDNLYTECMMDPSNICVKINNNGRVLKIKANANSKIKLEPLQGIRRLNFDDLIGDNGEVVLEDNGRRLIFNKEGAKYTGPGAWYNLRTSFKMPVILQGKKHVLECKAESQQCFVDGKLTLGPELKSCNSNEECGPQEKCSDNVCVVKRDCTLYRGNEQESRTRADILVLSTTMRESELKTFVEENLYGSGALFSTTPFSSNIELFNVWIMPKREREQGTDPAVEEGVSNIIANIDAYSNSWHESCPLADYLIVITDRTLDQNNAPFASGKVVYIPIISSIDRGPIKRIITHEFGGHAYGNLHDEYTTDSAYRPYNTNRINCAKIFSDAVRKFGEELATKARDNAWTGCGGYCKWDLYHCNEWYAPSEIERAITTDGNTRRTKTIMGSQALYGEFSDFDKNSISQKMNRRSV